MDRIKLKKTTACIYQCLYRVFCDVAAITNFAKVAATSFRKDTFNITRYGATADGVTLNTAPIAKAIDACNKKGRRRRYVVPAGLWNTGTYRAEKQCKPCLVKGAVLPVHGTTSTRSHSCRAIGRIAPMANQSPVSAEGQTNIAITGNGILDRQWRCLAHVSRRQAHRKPVEKAGGIRWHQHRWTHLVPLR